MDLQGQPLVGDLAQKYCDTRYADEGLLYGDRNAPVKKVMTCWMVTLEGLEKALREGVDTIITHEALYFPPNVHIEGNCTEFMSWPFNRQRIALLAKGNISVLRSHTTLDEICVYDDFAELLELGEPLVDESWLVRVFDGKGIPFGEYLERVKKALGMKYVRASRCDLDRPIKRIGMPWGGLGLSTSARYMEKLVEHQCDLFITGESDNYGMQFMVNSGIEFIETGHEISENPGLRHFAQTVGEDFPAVESLFFEVQPGCILR